MRIDDPLRRSVIGDERPDVAVEIDHRGERDLELSAARRRFRHAFIPFEIIFDDAR